MIVSSYHKTILKHNERKLLKIQSLPLVLAPFIMISSGTLVFVINVHLCLSVDGNDGTYRHNGKALEICCTECTKI